MSKPYLKVTSDFTEDFKKVITRFKNDQVLVGIPEGKAARSGAINNATLLAINNFGSPANNIPARPVMQNGMDNCKEELAQAYKNAVKNALSKGLASLEIYYERAGIIASNSIKKAITDQDFEGGGDNNEGPAESTLAARKSKGFRGTKSLIVTAQMRNSITYIVKV